MSLFAELKRRNVFKVATAYVVVGWLLTEIATTLLPTFGAPDWVAKVVIFVFALGFIPVLVFSWAFELTPEGIKREKDVDRGESITSETGRKLNYVTIAAVVAAVAFVTLNQTGRIDQTPVEEVLATSGEPSVAVLPFVNMSGNQENEYFSDGLTETLLHMLAQMPELKVAARTSSFAFKGQDSDIREIAAALDVAHVLEGSVQRSGDRVRITAQLIRANDGFHVWSENFDRTLDDIFAIQDEIASHVGDALSASLLGSKEPAPLISVGTENLEAYDKFLRATAEHVKGSYGSLQAAEGLLKDALALDPVFHDAKSRLAYVYADQWKTGLRQGPDGLQDSIRLLEQVLAEHPDDTQATSLLYETEIFSDVMFNRLDTAQDGINMLLAYAQQHPTDVETVMRAANVNSFMNGDPEQSIRLVRGLTTVDPLNPVVYAALGQAYLANEQWPEARDAAARSLELEPDQPNALSLIARAHQSEGDLVEYFRYYLQAIEVDPQDHELPGEVAVTLYGLGLSEHAAPYRARVLAIAPTSPASYMVEVLHAEANGDIEAARAHARRAVEDRIDNRQDALLESIKFLVRDAIRNDSIHETAAWFEQAIPSLADFDGPVDAVWEYVARYDMLALWYVTLPREEWLRRIDVLWAYAERWRFDPEEPSLPKAFREIGLGNHEDAINTAVTAMNETPVGSSLGWRDTFRTPYAQEIVDDPRIQAAMAKYEKDEAALRDSVLAFLNEAYQGSSR